MAAAPPPFSPRDARRQARDLNRLQRAQMKAQYAYMRRRPSFVGPLLLITTGVIALLLETDRLSAATFWPWYSRWWPAVLILIGLGLLVEHFLDRNNPQQGRRSIGGVVWLIVLLSLAGGASHAAFHHGGPWDGDLSNAFGDHGNWLSLMGEEHTVVHTLVQPIAAAGTLTIVNARGDVQVSPSIAGAPSEVRVEAHQIVHANSDDVAKRDLDATQPTLVANGANVTLNSPGRDGASDDLKVTVPAGIALVVRTTHGDVELSGLSRSVEVTASHGDVTVDNMGAGVHIQMDHGDITARDIAGDLAIDGRANDVSISGIKGRTLLNGDFFGDTRLEHVSSLVHFHSSRTDLEVPHLGGEMTLDSGDLRLVNPSGGLRLSTRSKDIEVTDLVGDAQIANSNGDMNVTSVMPLGNLNLTDHTGAIAVTVPSNANFSVQGSTAEDDEVKSEFPLTSQSSLGHKTLTGQVGQGGPHLEFSTDHGDLTLHRGSNHAPQAQVGEAPERPEPPEKQERQERSDKPERRLHSKASEPPQTSVQ